MERRLRFVRAVAMLSTGVIGACGARTLEDGAESAAIDAATADGPVEGPGPGKCLRSIDDPLPCRAGLTCGWGSGYPTCSNAPNAPTDVVACGSIYCASPYCKCVSASANTCDCNGPVPGPLPPPDLPAARVVRSLALAVWC